MHLKKLFVIRILTQKVRHNQPRKPTVINKVHNFAVISLVRITHPTQARQTDTDEEGKRESFRATLFPPGHKRGERWEMRSDIARRRVRNIQPRAAGYLRPTVIGL